jgi:hypothetical protein
MTFHSPPRLPPVLASALAAGLMLAVASCGHVTPLGPDAKPSHLRSPIVLQAMRVRMPGPAGECPAGFVTLSAPGMSPGLCYRKLGAPVTITSAAVSPVSSSPPLNRSGQVVAGPPTYQFIITLPAADVAALTAVSTRAFDSQGALDISVAGQIWALLMAWGPLTHGQLEMNLPSKNQALELQRLLAGP